VPAASDVSDPEPPPFPELPAAEIVDAEERPETDPPAVEPPAVELPSNDAVVELPSVTPEQAQANEFMA